MKKAFSFLVIAVLCLAIILPASADTLHLYRIDYDGVETFQALHPELQCTWSEQDYHNDYELSSALLTDSQGPAPMPVKNRPANRGVGVEDEEMHKSPRHIRSAAQSTTRRLPRESESMPEMSTPA